MGETVQSHLQISIPMPLGPTSHSPHSLMNDDVFLVYLISDGVTAFSMGSDSTVLQNWIAEALLLTIVGFVLYITTMNYYAVVLRRDEEVLIEWFGRPDTSYLRFVRLLSIVGGLIFLVSGFILHIPIEPIQGLLPSIGALPRWRARLPHHRG